MDQAIAGEISESTARTRINYAKWIWQIVSWDGILPFLLWSTPIAICSFVEDDGKESRTAWLALSAIFLSGIAFVVRFCCGLRYLSQNHCENLRGTQFICLSGGIGFLWLSDMLLIGCYDVWLNEFKTITDILLALTVWYSIYLPLMIVAMYPGREPVSEPMERLGNWEVRC